MTQGNRDSSRLQGFADPSVPGWEKRALEAVKARQKKSKRWTERRDGVLCTFDMGAKVLLSEAARRRGISMAGYARRALAAMIAYDLDIPIGQVTQYMSVPVEYKATLSNGRPVRLNDDGRGYGPWVITGLEEVE